ncbi:unnamed protein product, partial [Urochloa humidicola]
GPAGSNVGQLGRSFAVCQRVSTRQRPGPAGPAAPFAVCSDHSTRQRMRLCRVLHTAKDAALPCAMVIAHGKAAANPPFSVCFFFV